MSEIHPNQFDYRNTEEGSEDVRSAPLQPSPSSTSESFVAPTLPSRDSFEPQDLATEREEEPVISFGSLRDLLGQDELAPLLPKSPQEKPSIRQRVLNFVKSLVPNFIKKLFLKKSIDLQQAHELIQARFPTAQRPKEEPPIHYLSKQEMITSFDKINGVGAYKAAKASSGVTGLEGFVHTNDEGKETIYINKDSAAHDAGLHELMHVYSQGAIESVPFHLNEGLTEMYTHLAQGGTRFTPSSTYPKQMTIAKRMREVVGTEVTDRAYFNGEWGNLASAFDRKLGQGKYQEFLRAMGRRETSEPGSTTDEHVGHSHDDVGDVPADYPRARQILGLSAARFWASTIKHIVVNG